LVQDKKQLIRSQLARFLKIILELRVTYLYDFNYQKG